MRINELYEKFEIMPQLVEHQLRVGGVGQIVAENWSFGEGQAKRVDVELATTLCLLHDMGNIVKFDLSEEMQQKGMFGKAENLPYWRNVQNKYWDKYGTDVQKATMGILAEAGLGKLNQYIEEETELYFAEAGEKELEKARAEAVILMYADMRVTPQGVVSYRTRVDDLRDRYGGGKSPRWYGWTQEFEKWIQSRVTIGLKTITEEVVRERWDSLLSVRI